MEISRSASCPSFTPNDSHAKPRFGRLLATHAPHAFAQCSVESDDSAVHVALSAQGMAHARKHVSYDGEVNDPLAISDVMCWLIAIGLGIIMGWSAAGQLLN